MQKETSFYASRVRPELGRKPEFIIDHIQSSYQIGDRLQCYSL